MGEGGTEREKKKKKQKERRHHPSSLLMMMKGQKVQGPRGMTRRALPWRVCFEQEEQPAVKRQLSFSKRLGRARPPNRGQKILSKSQEQELGRRRWAGAEDVSYQWPPLDSCSFVTCPKSIPFQSDSNLGDIFFHCILTEFLHLPIK